MTELADALRRALADAADPVAAPAMQAYMKSTLPFRGVSAAPRRRLLADVLRTRPPLDAATWQATVEELWCAAAFREERYLATDLAWRPAHRRFRTPALLPLWDELIVTGAWWDHVDEVATHLAGELLDGDDGAVAATLRRWAVDDDPWRRRAAIVAQAGRGAATDPELLADCCRPSVESPWFFHRKGIGWALRAYAAVDPGWVERFLATERVSGLTRREAQRGIDRARRSAG